MRRVLFTCLIISLTIACKKLVNPPVITAPSNYLVVNGGIVLNDTTVISLSRTVNVTGNARSNPELGAVVSIENSSGSSYTLTPRNNGDYILPPSNLPSNQNYRLKIKTADGKQYASDFVPARNSPPVDSVYYQVNGNGLLINLNTHDPSNNTRYYRWDCIETYMIQSAYNSHYKVVDHDTTALRTPAEQIYHCWITDTTNNLVLASSAKLSSDVISNKQILSLASNTEKLRVRYSLLVKQYALTSEAYNYYTQLKQNTEQLGTIFDPQPSELTGNIHSLSDKNEPVIGYVTAGIVSEKRIFIDSSDLPGWTADTPYGGCTLDSLKYHHLGPGAPGVEYYDVHDLIYTGYRTPIDEILGGYAAGGFTATTPECGDCTLRGTNKQPAFWK